MIIHSDIHSLPLESTVATLGIFDGVHRGHQHLLSRVVAESNHRGIESAVVTFWPHPRYVLGKAENEFRLLNTIAEKSELIRKAGIDHLIIVPFDLALAGISGEQFIREYLVEKVHASCILVGDDVRFGAGGSGNTELLIKMAAARGFEVIRLETHLHIEKRISSTFIRACLNAGDLASANKLLGYHYFITGSVATGNRLGKTIGFPTANVVVAEEFKQIPSDGVYAVLAETGARKFGGMLNIGIRPTIEDHDHKTIEVHMFGADGNFYGESLTIRFVERLRDEMKFENLDALRVQLGEDRVEALKCLNLADNY